MTEKDRSGDARKDGGKPGKPGQAPATEVIPVVRAGGPASPGPVTTPGGMSVPTGTPSVGTESPASPAGGAPTRAPAGPGAPGTPPAGGKPAAGAAGPTGTPAAGTPGPVTPLSGPFASATSAPIRSGAAQPQPATPPASSGPNPPPSQPVTAAQPAARSGGLAGLTAAVRRTVSNIAPEQNSSGSERRIRYRLARVDPWSVTKLSLLLSIAIGIVFTVAVLLLWVILDLAGVIDAVSQLVGQITGTGSGAGGFDLASFLSLPRVLGVCLLIAVVDVVLLTALATVAAYLYNLSADFSGGLELTLAEDE